MTDTTSSRSGRGVEPRLGPVYFYCGVAVTVTAGWLLGQPNGWAVVLVWLVAFASVFAAVRGV